MYGYSCGEFIRRKQRKQAMKPLYMNALEIIVFKKNTKGIFVKYISRGGIIRKVLQKISRPAAIQKNGCRVMGVSDLLRMESIKKRQDEIKLAKRPTWTISVLTLNKDGIRIHNIPVLTDNKISKMVCRRLRSGF